MKWFFNRNNYPASIPTHSPAVYFLDSVLGIANLCTVFSVTIKPPPFPPSFPVFPFPPTCLFLPLPPQSSPDISPNVEARIKRLRERAGRKYTYVRILIRFVKKTIERRKKNKPTRFLCSFCVSCYHPTHLVHPLSPCLPLYLFPMSRDS